MSAYNNYIQANKSLEVPDITIRRFTNGLAPSFNRARLDIFYIPEFDVFLLYQKDFSYILSRNTFAMIILFQDQAHRSYVLPNINGYYILELKSPQNLAVIANFETILRNYSQVSYRSGQEQQVQVPVQNKKTNYLDWSNNFTKASKFLRVGGETLKFHLVNAANKMATKGTENINPNQLTEKTLEELKAGTGIVYIPRDNINSILANNREIEAMTQSQFDRNQNAQPLVNNQASPWNEFKRATLDSANLVWQGMEEAASSLYQTLKAKTHNRTSNKNAQYQYQQQYQPQYQPQYQQQYQQQLNLTGLDSTRNALSRSQTMQFPQNTHHDALSRSQSLEIPHDYQRFEDNTQNYDSQDSLLDSTTENMFKLSNISANNGLYPNLSGPFAVRDSNIENNGLSYVPYAESQVFLTPEHPNEGKKQ